MGNFQRGGDPRYADQGARRREGDDGEFIEALHRLDGRPYGAYKSLIGDWNYGNFSLAFDRAQADPYAPPSPMRVTVSTQAISLPEDCLSTPDQRLATADYLLRVFERNIKRFSKPGTVQVARCGQEILERSACRVSEDQVELRFQVQLPARGRSILGHLAATIFDADVPDIILESFDFISDEVGTTNLEGLRAHVHAYEDYQALQAHIADNGWMAFVANGAVLARRSGISQLPLEDSVPFEAPASLRVSVDLPHAGHVDGMSVKPGITVIAGGGYHGKSTLLSAISRGVYAHIPGDGRELVATTPSAMKIRAADGRGVTNVDVSPFIEHLPGDLDTTSFSTENASGSTSQAASIIEAIELGSPLLLIDEDTSATNLLIRDSRMRELVEVEPITPLVDRIGALSRERHVSTLLVMGGSGDYLDIADTVLLMNTYRCFDVTERAREVVASQPRVREDRADFPEITPRVIGKVLSSNDRPRTKSIGRDRIQLDKKNVDLTDVEQLVDSGQTEAIAWSVRGIVEHLADGKRTLPELLALLDQKFDDEGLDSLRSFGARENPAFLVRPRPVEVGAALNRFRGLVVGESRSPNGETIDESEAEDNATGN
ncbi:ABC-ATPase domain-containing protein [Arcanobacterium haemolyticum]|nr:ABC-ATPase domain-containing protein [Arcanobacterium haemolyticum]